MRQLKAIGWVELHHLIEKGFVHVPRIEVRGLPRNVSPWGAISTAHCAARRLRPPTETVSCLLS
jgi:hypothetical protein